MVKKHLFKRKGLSVLLVLALMLSSVGPVLAAGDVDTEAVFTVGSTVASAGQEGILVPVSVQDSPEFVAIGLQFTFPDELTLTDIKRGSDLVGGTIAKNTATQKVNFDWDEAAFPDGEIFVLEFTVSGYAQSGDYTIDVATVSGWIDDNFDNLIPKAMVPGKITVTGLNAAKVGSTEYSTLSAALAAAFATGQPASVTMISNVQIADASDRMVIPDGADITLDMNGFTITSALAGNPVDHQNKPVADSVDSATIEVQAGGKLNIVDTSTDKDGEFTHTTGDLYTRFLVNSGTLNMDNIKVSNFYDGVRDGSLFTGKGSGAYGTISNCEFTATETGGISNYQKVALNFGAGVAGTVDGCEITGYDVSSTYSIVVGTYNDEGSLELLKDCLISGLVLVSRKGTVDTIKDNTIINKPEGDAFARGIEIDGSVGTIDGGYIEGVYDAIKVGSSGTVNLILDGEFKAWDQAVNNSGTIDEISGGNFEVGYYNALCNTGTIHLISGGEFKSADYRAVYNEEGTIGEISGGTFIAGSKFYGVTNKGGTIGEISGGLFYSDSYSPLRNGDSYAYKKSVINLISGGTFVNNANSSTLSCADPGEGSTIGEISGGTFISKNQSAILISGNVSGVEKISGGTFIGKVAALNMKSNTIESISGGVFYGQGVAVYLDGATGEHEAHINDISGGYFKTLGENGLIVTLGDSSWASDEGFDFATVPLRVSDLPADFPDEETIEDRIGFHHFGETVDVTWKVEGEADIEDLFVKNDPIYFSYDEPEKEGFNFRGWNDGAILYKPEDAMPLASSAITYNAEFFAIGSEEDYKASLVLSAEQSNNINAREEFNVDIVITSTENEQLYGATVPIVYDKDKLDLLVGSSILLEGLGFNTNGDGTAAIKVLGYTQNDEGWILEGGSIKLGTLKFKAKPDVDTGEITMAVINPVVNQQGAVESQIVEVGDDLKLNLYNLKVTFTAGSNVTMDQAVAYVKYNTEGLYTDTTYSTAFTEPSPTAATYYTLDEPKWKPAEGDNVSFDSIGSVKFTEDASYEATASPEEFSFNYEAGTLNNIAGLKDSKAVYGTDVTFSVTAKSNHTIGDVSYKVGELGALTVLTAVEGIYMIPGNLIIDNIYVGVDYLVTGEISFTSNDTFNSLPEGYKLLELKVAAKLESGAYEYDDNVMFYSSAYSKPEQNEYVYLYVVKNGVTEANAQDQIQINSATSCIELTYNKDVNIDGKMDSTDPLLTYELYRGIHFKTGFGKATMQIRLEADVDGDRIVDTTDATLVLNAALNE